MKNKDLDIKKEIATTIGYGIFSFYQNKNTQKFNRELTSEEIKKTYFDAEKDAYETLSHIKISDILIRNHWFKKNEIIVVCKSPGWLIGTKGELINYVTTYFHNMAKARIELKEYSNCTIGVKENKWISNLYAFQGYSSLF